MAKYCCRILLVVLVAVIGLSASMPTFTLYPARDPVTKYYDEGKSHFSFKRGATQDVTRSTKIGTQLRRLGHGWRGLVWTSLWTGTRSSLGTWASSPGMTLTLFLSEPRPLVEKGKKWEPLLVTSDPNGAWTRSGRISQSCPWPHVPFARERRNR